MREAMFGDRQVGGNNPCFIIAEISSNHGGSLDKACELIDAAAECGADAVKICLDDLDGGITIDCDKPDFVLKSGPWAGQTLYQLYRKGWTPPEWVPELKRIAETSGVLLFPTVSSMSAYDWFPDAPMYKVASFEVTDTELIAGLMDTGKPVIISTGCGFPDVHTLGIREDDNVFFLHCVSKYPAHPEEFDLMSLRSCVCDTRVSPYRNFSIDGISDHSYGNTMTIAAVALGAKIVERHFNLSANKGTLDDFFSLKPNEFSRMVTDIRYVESAMETKEIEYDMSLCKSLYVVEDVKNGEFFTQENVKAIRPGYGLEPMHYHGVLGKMASRDIERGTALSWEMIC